MTPDEIATLQGIGTDWVQGFAAIINETVLLTVYAVLVFHAGRLLLTKDRRRVRAYVLSIAAVFTMFAVALVLWVLDLTSFIYEGKMTLIENPGDDIGTKLDNALGFIFKLVAAQDALYAYMSLLGDAIIIHRVWMLKAYYRMWIFLIPCSLLLGSTIATVMLTYCVAVTGSEIVLGNFENPAFCRNVQEVTYILPLVTTTVATILIGATAWRYMKAVKPLHNHSGNSYGRRGRSARGEKILMLLVESGFFYFLFFLIQVIEDVPSVHDWIDRSTTLTFLFEMYSYCSSVIVVRLIRFLVVWLVVLSICNRGRGIYPTIIIVLAHSKHAVIDGASNAASGTLSSSRAGRMTGTTTGNAAPNWPVFQVEVETRRDEIELNAALDSRGKDHEHGEF